VVVTQLREVPAAERSGEAAEEHEDDRAAPEQVVESDGLTAPIREGEARSVGADRGARAVNGHGWKCRGGKNEALRGVVLGEQHQPGGCVASISMFEMGEASRRLRIVVKESEPSIPANDNLALAA